MVPLAFQVGLVITHLVAQVSTAGEDVGDVTAAVIILVTDPDLALYRPVARNRKVRGQMGQQEGAEDPEVMADVEGTSTQKARRDMDMKVLEEVEALEGEEEEDTEVDGDIMDAEDLLHSVAQQEWVDSI